jgi:hypothetical protein
MPKTLPRVPFEVLNVEVSKLYEKQFNPSEVDAINKHCEYIGEFIRACGWSETEFIRAMFGLDDPNIN